MSDEQTFGPYFDITFVEAAVQKTIEEWWATYARWFERRTTKPELWLPQPQSYVKTSDFNHFPEEGLPSVMIVAAQADHPRMDGNKNYRATFPVAVFAYVSAPDRTATEQLAKYYGAVIRTLILQKGSLGLEAATCWEGEHYGVHIADRAQRTIGTAEQRFSVEVRNVVRRLTGPAVPIPTEPVNWPTVTKATFPIIKAEPVAIPI